MSFGSKTKKIAVIGLLGLGIGVIATGAAFGVCKNINHEPTPTPTPTSEAYVYALEQLPAYLADEFSFIDNLTEEVKKYIDDAASSQANSAAWSYPG